MTTWLKALGGWFDRRLQLGDSLLPVLRHKVPRGLGWWYVFGSATMTCFVLQVLTGICLALYYVPSASDAYASLEALNYCVTFGWLLRAIHYWSASGMVVLMGLHVTRVFLFAAYKYPRELTWIIGVGLLVLTLGLAFTGQVLRWDQDAYWGIGVGMSMVGRVPVLGPHLVRLVLGGPIIGGDTLSRFFSLHVFWLPGLLIGLLVIHLYLVVKLGISSRPVPGEQVRPQTYQAEYDKKLHEGVPFFPHDFVKDAIFSSLCVIAIVTLAAAFGPHGPSDPPDPRLIHTEPRPDWEFRWLFALMALMPPNIETFAMLALPPLVLLLLVLLPFISRTGERAPSRRPVAVLTIVLVWAAFGVLTWLGYSSPWSPRMNAWSADPLPVPILDGLRYEDSKARPDKEDNAEGLKNLSLRRLQGAAVFQNKSCRNCHAIDGVGGQRGPDLTTVGTRLTHDQLVRQVIQGGGNMPAYGKQLSPPEVEGLAAFLGALVPTRERPAEPTAR